MVMPVRPNWGFTAGEVQIKLKELLDYDPNTGIFKWRKTVNHNGAKKGSTAGTLSDRGYIKIKIMGKLHRAHILAWIYSYGKFPCKLDHKNNNTTDNRLSNLREATQQQNIRNSRKRKGCTSRFKGVAFIRNRWESTISVSGKKKYLGRFKSEESAARAYDNAAVRLFGDFAKLNLGEQ